jgi:myo-inositol 2-dehydrogenase/D-chiro-inositol 1-dehydrogenase
MAAGVGVIDVALLGAGRMGRVHGGNVGRHGKARLRYVVDSVAENARAVSAALGAETAELRAVLDDKAVKAVIITTPTPTHFDLVVACARAGKAIFCEKPIDLTHERVIACLSEVARCGVPFMVGFQRRFDPTFRALHRAIKAGAIGDVEVVRITSRDPYPPPPGYIATSGGLFRDMMIHDFDMARWVLGEEPVEVFATGSCLVDPGIAKLSDVDTAIAVLRTSGGRLCHIENSRRAVYGYDQRIEVFGSKGSLQAGNQVATSMELWTEHGVTKDKPLPFFPERYVVAYAAEIEHFIEAVAQGTAPEVGGEAGRASLALADAAQRSCDERVPVRLS